MASIFAAGLVSGTWAHGCWQFWPGDNSGHDNASKHKKQRRKVPSEKQDQSRILVGSDDVTKQNQGRKCVNQMRSKTVGVGYEAVREKTQLSIWGG
jgi:hypothetical protein